MSGVAGSPFLSLSFLAFWIDGKRAFLVPFTGADSQGCVRALSVRRSPSGLSFMHAHSVKSNEHRQQWQTA
jgi:hypothetical protein